jgi:hypothetical protein
VSLLKFHPFFVEILSLIVVELVPAFVRSNLSLASLIQALNVSARLFKSISLLDCVEKACLD